MKFKIKGNSAIGKGMDVNQDVVRMYEDNNIICVSVNDGCSMSEYGYEAAEINAKSAEVLSLDPKIFKLPEKDFKKLFYNECMERFDETGISIKELSATTAFVIINKSNNKFIAFTCGDTAIMSYNHDLRPSILIPPKNGLSKKSTYFTNNSSSIKNFGEYKTGIIDSNRILGFIIYSDGAEYLSNSISSQENYAKILVDAVYKSDDEYCKKEKIIFESLKRYTKDDISYAIIAAFDDSPLNVNETTDISDNNKKTAKSCTRKYESDSRKPITETKSSEDNTETLLEYLRTPRSFSELLKSSFVDETNIFITLSLLYRIGAITCIDDKFKSK